MRLRPLVIALVLAPAAACSKKPDAPAPAPAPTTAPAPTSAAPTPDAAPAVAEADAGPAAPAADVAPAAPTADVAPVAPEGDAVAPPPAPGAACAGDTRTLDLGAVEQAFAALHAAYEKGEWRTAPKDESGAPGIDDAKVPKAAPLLRQLGFEEPAALADLGADETSFDVFDCTFGRQDLASEPGQKDVVVSVSCANESMPDFSDGDTLHVGLVLRPVAGQANAYCEVGRFERRDMVSGRPCLADVGDAPQWKLTPVELVAAGRQALREDYSGGLCGGGTARGNDITETLWGVEGGHLVEYFSAVLDEVAYESPCPPTQGKLGKVTLGEAFPKVISYSREVVCEAAVEGCDAGPPCKAEKGVETWTYADGTYRRQGAPALAEDAAPAEPTTAADLAARAREAMKARRWADAVADLRKAFALDPELPRLRGELGWALFNAGELADARTMTEAALAKADKPGSKGALLYNLGRIDEAEKKPAQAIEHYKASLAARPGNDAVQKRLDVLTKPQK